MAFWFAHGSGVVGVEHGVIRARDFACLIDGTEMVARTLVERDAMLAVSRATADATLAQAQQQADVIIAQAQATFDEARARGLEQGLLEAATTWASQAIDAALATRRTLFRQSERLSSLVSMAVERVIDEEDRAALFRRSLRTVVKLVKDVPMLTMRVNEDDCPHAKRAVGSVLQQAGTAMSIEVVGDPALVPGTCRFESDDGIIDTSLATQIEALRGAVRRAAHRMSRPPDTAAVADCFDASSRAGQFADDFESGARHDGEAAVDVPLADDYGRFE